MFNLDKADGQTALNGNGYQLVDTEKNEKHFGDKVSKAVLMINHSKKPDAEWLSKIISIDTTRYQR